MNILKTALLALFLVVFTSCKEKKNNSQLSVLPKVEVAIAKIDSLYNTVSVASQITGLNSEVIQPRINGFLTNIHFECGDIVKKGDLLFSIDPTPFTTTLLAARADREKAQAAEILAQRNYQRAEPLALIDAISQSDLDQYRATYKAAVASTKAAKEQLRSAELEVGYTKIYASLDGIASKTTATIGDYIGPGTQQSTLTTVTQLDTISAEIPIPTFRYLKANSDNSFDNSNLLSDIKLTLPDSTQYQYMGEYYYTLAQTPSATSLVVIVTKFPNPSLQLKNGMFARIEANLGPRKGCIVVPEAAVSQLQGINSVWVIKADSTAEWRRVELGDKYDTLWSIESGVDVGESVVVSGAAKLHNGAKVTPTVEL